MTENEFAIIREFIEGKSLHLMQHAEKSFAKVGFDITKHHELTLEGRRFIIITTNVFYHILTSVLAEACEKYPENFGNDDVDKVLEAIYKIENVGCYEQFSDFLKTEQFAWVLELGDGQVCPNILRVELFRKVDTLKNDSTKTEFTGGVFHAFKHFNYKGIPLSTKRENKNIEHPKSIIDFLIQGFFFAELKPSNKSKFYSIITFNNSHNLRFDYYFEAETEIYFVNSIRVD